MVTSVNLFWFCAAKLVKIVCTKAGALQSFRERDEKGRFWDENAVFRDETGEVVTNGPVRHHFLA
jgi:hypothetical protein